MKKCLKILACVLVTILALSTIVMAATDDYWSETDISGVSGLTDKTTVSSSANSMLGIIIGVLRIVALGVALIMIAVLAMKYMSAAPSDRADIKKHAVVYVVGAVVLFAAFGILSIIQDFASNIK